MWVSRSAFLLLSFLLHPGGRFFLSGSRKRSCPGMACGRGQITNTELRDRLRQLGVSPGTITDSTRNVYLHKLRALTESTRTSTTEPASTTKQDISWAG